jgi:hypothetical protein
MPRLPVRRRRSKLDVRNQNIGKIAQIVQFEPTPPTNEIFTERRSRSYAAEESCIAPSQSWLNSSVPIAALAWALMPIRSLSVTRAAQPAPIRRDTMPPGTTGFSCLTRRNRGADCLPWRHVPAVGAPRSRARRPFSIGCTAATNCEFFFQTRARGRWLTFLQAQFDEGDPA